MSFKELLIFQDKYISVISRQMEATVLIILCNIFAARRTKCSRKVYLSMTGMITFQCSLVRLHKQTNMSLLCKNTKTLSYLEFTLSQFDPIGLIGYLSSHVQRAIVEWLLNIFTIVMTLTKKKKKKYRIRKSQCSPSRGRLEKALSALFSSSETQGLWVLCGRALTWNRLTAPGSPRMLYPKL